MNMLAKVGGILGGGTLVTALVASGSPNASEMPVAAPAVAEQGKVLQKSDTKVESQKAPTETKEEIMPKATPKAQAQPKTASSCHPSYSGCLKQDAGDYDCASGSGNGPNYTGPVQVSGSDPFDLDRDNDGWGCE